MFWCLTPPSLPAVGESLRQLDISLSPLMQILLVCSLYIHPSYISPIFSSSWLHPTSGLYIEPNPLIFHIIFGYLIAIVSCSTYPNSSNILLTIYFFSGSKYTSYTHISIVLLSYSYCLSLHSQTPQILLFSWPFFLSSNKYTSFIYISIVFPTSSSITWTSEVAHLICLNIPLLFCLSVHVFEAYIVVDSSVSQNPFATPTHTPPFHNPT